MGSLRIGIIGCGGIAHHHVCGYRTAGAEVTKIYDASADVARRFAASAELRANVVAMSVDEVLDAGVDAVSVCTPPGTHLACCEPFLRRGIAVLCEKPMEASLAAARQLAEVVRETETPFMIGFCHRFHGPIIEIKRLLDRGTLGRPVLFRNIFGGWLPLSGNHRINRDLAGGGVLADNAAHAIDLFRFFVGEPAELVARTANLVQHMPVEDFCSVYLLAEHPFCAAGEIACSYSLRVGANQIELFATEGTAIITYGAKHLPECAYRPHDRDEWILVEYEHHPQRFTGEVAYFLSCVARGKGTRPTPGVQDGLRTAEIVDAAYQSAASASVQIRSGRPSFDRS